MWIEGNYRRNLLDMHIDDWNEEFLSKADPVEYAQALAEAGVQAAMIKAMPHTGLCYYPTGVGRMHRGLKDRDLFGEMLAECHKRNIKVIAYYSQIFDNYAASVHPEWQTRTVEGKTHFEYRHTGWFRNGRYGIVCPNNMEYREYVKAHLTELNEMYDFEGMFLDMTFWPDVCYCEACRDRYRAETGRELPTVINWADENFRKWQLSREKWMAEFAAFSTGCIKSIKPEVTVEHQMSMVACSFIHACTEWATDQVDYTGGDYYGGFMQQTFINKYYRNISPNLPFVYHTSRCDPELAFHTTTKSRDELMLHVITALVHNGAFLLVDAINPDGTIVPKVYRELMKSIYERTKTVEPFVSGDLISDVNIWFSSHSKFDPGESNIPMEERNFTPDLYMEAPLKLASILREYNIPFDVVGSRNLKECKSKVLALCNVSQILDEEMEDIERYVAEGGKLYVSGAIGHGRLYEMLGMKNAGICTGGMTEENFTYLDPAAEGQKLFEGFDEQAPLSVPMKQYLVSFEDLETSAENRTVLATLTLPYTIPDSPQFSAIHSNPPGIHTGRAAVFETAFKKGKIIYSAAPIEMSGPFMSRKVVANVIKALAEDISYTSDAPKMVETIVWKKDGNLFLALINEQEEAPIVSIHDINVVVPKRLGDFFGAKLIADGRGETSFSALADREGLHVIVDKLDIFAVFSLR